MKIKKFFFTFAIFSLLLTVAWSQEGNGEYTLDFLLSATKQNHPELLKLQEEYKRSRLDVQDAWAGLGPTVDLQVSGTYMVNPPLGAMYINTDDLLNEIQ